VAGNFDYAHQQDQGTSRMIIAVGNPVLRLSIARKAREYAIPFLNAVHPSSVIMPTVTLGEGNMISALAVINSNSVIGDNVIINTGAVVEHDSALADGVTISPGVHLGGRTTIERGVFVCTGAIVLPRIYIGAGAVVAAGAVVTKNVPKGVLVQGMPARIVEEISEAFDWKRLFF